MCLSSACSYTLGSRWVTLVEHVKTDTFVLKNLKPATVYLFMLRAVNSHGISDPSPISDSVRTQGRCRLSCLTDGRLDKTNQKKVNLLLFYRPDVPTDSPSTIPGVDHHHIQKELGDVVVHLDTPTIVSSSAVRVRWVVSVHACRSV